MLPLALQPPGTAPPTDSAGPGPCALPAQAFGSKRHGGEWSERGIALSQVSASGCKTCCRQTGPPAVAQQKE